MSLEGPLRHRLPFRSVNRRHASDYVPGLQRHHLLPRQLLQQRCFGGLFDAVSLDRAALDDFRTNGLLLPSQDAAALHMALPLHRGPHRRYNAVVMERVGRIESGWAMQRGKDPERARSQAMMRLRLLQGALRRRLLSADRSRFALNRNDPLGQALDFTELDAMADALWEVPLGS